MSLKKSGLEIRKAQRFKQLCEVLLLRSQGLLQMCVFSLWDFNRKMWVTAKLSQFFGSSSLDDPTGQNHTYFILFFICSQRREMCEAQCFALMGLLFKVVYLFISFLLYNPLFTLKEGNFEDIFFAVEATGWILWLTLLPMGIHITFSYAWKIWALHNDLGIKPFCPWGVNFDIRPGFSSWFGPVPWGIIKKSMAPVILTGTLWEISAAHVHNGVVPLIPWLSEGWASALCATDPTALCRGRLL